MIPLIVFFFETMIPLIVVRSKIEFFSSIFPTAHLHN